jgi:CBS domain-containing protein
MQVNAGTTRRRINDRSMNLIAGLDVMTSRHASDIISHQNPIMLPPTATVQRACQGMRDRNVGAVLVTEGDRRLVGIFTGRDAVGRVLAEGRNTAKTTLAEVMTRDPDTIPPGKTAIEVLRLMQDAGYRHLPVVAGGRVVGAVTSTASSRRVSTRPASGSGSDSICWIRR